MTHYHFKTREFAVSDTGIHLLRSGFSYKTINFSTINELIIEKGKELHNWIVIFFIGTVLLLGGFYLSLQVIESLIYGDIAPRNARLILILFIPCIGAYFIYTSVATGTLLKINYAENIKDKFPLKEIVKEKELAEFKSFMNDKLGAKFKPCHGPNSEKIINH